MIRLLVLSLLIAVAGDDMAQTPKTADIYAPGRAIDPKTLAPTLTIDRYRDDTIELIELLRKNYGKRKVFLLGHSWVQ
jgi:hypothetical protein